MTNNLSDFQTILWPAVKTSNVGFYKKPSAGFTSGQVIQAPFTRAGAGRKVIDASGNLVDAAANVPAWTFPIGGSSAGCLYLSFLPSVENLLTYSEQFDNAAWLNVDVTVTPDNLNSPDGTANADLITEGTAGTAYVGRNVTVTSGATATVSFFVKYENQQWVQLRVINSGNTFTAWFDVLNGAKGNTSTSGTGVFDDSNIVDLENGWYQISITGSIPATTVYAVQLYSAASNGSTTRVNNAAYNLFGAQLKEGSYISPLDYVKTEASAVTRSIDSITAITDIVGDGYITDGSNYTVMFQLESYYQSISSNRFPFRLSNGGTVKLFFVARTTNNRVVLNDAVNTTDVKNETFYDGKSKVVISATSSEVNVSINGFLVYTASGDYTIDSFTNINVDLGELGIDLKMLNFAPTALTASQAEAASSWPSFDLMVSDLGYS